LPSPAQDENVLPARGGLSIGHANEDEMNEIITSYGDWYLKIEKGWEYFSLLLRLESQHREHRF
jgi:hypothetical protein